MTENRKSPPWVDSAAALNEEARRRGISYGKLCSITTEEQQREIVDRYKDKKEKAEVKRKRGRPRRKGTG